MMHDVTVDDMFHEFRDCICSPSCRQVKHLLSTSHGDSSSVKRMIEDDSKNGSDVGHRADSSFKTQGG